MILESPSAKLHVRLSYKINKATSFHAVHQLIDEMIQSKMEIISGFFFFLPHVSIKTDMYFSWKMKWMTCIINDKIYIYTNLYFLIWDVTPTYIIHTHSHTKYHNIRKVEIPMQRFTITDLVIGLRNLLTHVHYRFLKIEWVWSNTETRIPLTTRWNTWLNYTW
jgi:hypothetical protein